MAEEWDGLRSWQLASAGSCEVLYGRGSYATLVSARSGIEPSGGSAWA